MSNFILAGLFTEGTTDIRFLESVVKKTLDDVAFDCTGNIETELQVIKIEKTGLSFNDQVLTASRSSKKDYGVTILFVHTDADGDTSENIFKFKIIPATEIIDNQDAEQVCKTIVAIVPVYMTESWMLADKELLKSEIGILGHDSDLGISKNPEEISNPKSVIENIIRISKEEQTKRRRNKGLDISELYQIIGQKIDTSELEKLQSYRQFKIDLQEVCRKLNFLHN